MSNTANGNGGQRSMIVSATDKQNNIKKLFEANKASLAAVLPKHVTADRLMKIALSVTSKDAKLLACNPVSLLRCVVGAASLGLEAGGLLGEAYLVPFKDECTLIIGYKGLVRLARNSGEIKNIRARVVYKNDTFKIVQGLTEDIIHEPNLQNTELKDDDIIAVYAVAEYVNGSPQFEYMTKPQIDAIRARSASATSGPWVTDYAEMAKKTVLRRLAKILPLSPEKAESFQKAIAHDNAVEGGQQSPILDADFTVEEGGTTPDSAPKTRGDSIADRVSANGKVAHNSDGVVTEGAAQ